MKSIRAQSIQANHIYVCKHSGSMFEQCDHEELLDLDSEYLPSYTRVPRLVNLALSLRENNEGVFISGDDSEFPQDYISSLSNQIRVNPKIGIISGNKIERGVTNRAAAPEGSGRLISSSLMNQVQRFPTSIIWESWILLKSLKLGYQNKVIPDLTFQHLRPLAAPSVRTFGHSSHMLGYPLPYMIMRTLLSVTSRSNMRKREAMNMFAGQVEAILLRYPKCDIADWTRNFAVARMVPKSFRFHPNRN